MPNEITPQGQWRGVDASALPEDLAADLLAAAENVFVDTDRALTTRPGLVGRLAAPLPDGCHAPLAYLKADGTADAVFTSGGRLYRLADGDAAPTELALSGVAAGGIASDAARAARIGHYGYLVDGAGPLLRFDLTGGGTLTALDAPTAAPSAGLTSRLLDAFADASQWAADTLTGAGPTNRLPNPTLAGGSGTDAYGRIAAMPHWATAGPSPDFKALTATAPDVSGTFMILDTPGDEFLSDAVPNDAQALDAGRRATTFLVGFDYLNTDDTTGPSVVVTVIAYASTDGSGAVLGEAARETPTPVNTVDGAGNQLAPMTVIVPFGDMDTPIGSYRVSLRAGRGNSNASTGPLLTNPRSWPVAAPVALTASDAGLRLSLPPPADGSQTGFLAGLHLRHTFAAPLDLSGANVVDLGLSPATTPAAGVTPAGLSLFLRLQKSGDAAWHDTNAVTVTPDGLTAFVDITTVPLAVRQACARIELVFTADVTLPPGGALTLGPLTGAGDLSVGLADYAYVFTEVDSAGDATLANVVESDPSPDAPALTPTATQAEALVTLPARANAAADYLRVWRRGGAFPDGLARRVASVPVGADVAYGSDPANPHYGWDHAARTLTDDTPDSFLLDPTTPTAVYGREAAPAGAQAVCAWQNRLAVARGGTLWLSWLVEQDAQAALYFNAVNLPGDPLAPVKGATFQVGNDDGDPIVGLIPMGSNLFFRAGFLVVLKRNSVWLVGGTDPSNFYLQSYLIAAGEGLAAPRACGVVGGKVWYLSPSGVREFDGNFADPKSVAVDRVMLPRAPDGTAALDAAALSRAWMLAHDRRLYLGLPQAGDAAPSAVWVYDTRHGAWAGRWTPMPLTGGASLSATGAAYGAVLAGADGQVYALSGASDRATPAAPPLPVSFSVRGRAAGGGAPGSGGAAGDGGFRVRLAERVYLAATADAPQTVQVSVTNEAGASWRRAYQVGAGGRTTARLKPAPWTRGALLTVGVSGDATARVKVLRLALSTQPAGFGH